MRSRHGTVRSAVAVAVALLVGGVGLSGHTCPHHVSPSSRAPGDRSAEGPVPHEHGAPSDHLDPSLDASADGRLAVVRHPVLDVVDVYQEVDAPKQALVPAELPPAGEVPSRTRTGRHPSRSS